MTGSALTQLESAWLAQGFAPFARAGGFLESIARPFARGEGEYRVEITTRHCNPFGTAHGGLIATLADSCLGHTLAQRLPREALFVTATLNVDYLRPVAAGAWLSAQIDRVRIGARLCHLSGVLLLEDDEPVAAMRGIFAILRERLR